MEVTEAIAQLSSGLSHDGHDRQVTVDEKSIPRTVEIPLDISLSEPHVDANAALVAEMRGRVLDVPNMILSMKNWPQGERNKYYERVRDAFNTNIDRVVPDQKRAEKFKLCDFASFCSLWWPHGEWEDFHAASFFILWLFIWDDTLDAHDHDLSDDFDGAKIFRQQTTDYIKHCLGLWKESDGPEPPCPSVSCSLFKDFSDRVVKKFKQDRIETIFREVARYIHECGVEQSYRLAGYLPNLDEYIENRTGTSAVDILGGVFELFLDHPIPDYLMYTPEMAVVWRETNLCIIILNDVLSLMKEMKTDCIINIVPILYRQGIPWDDVVPELIEELDKVRERLDEAADKLAHLAKDDDPLVLKDLADYINLCKLSCTGTFIYTTESPRYKIKDCVREDGSARIVL